jgi:polysaccharide biosynthesis protein PslJ
LLSSTSSDFLQNWFTSLDRRAYALVVGATIGLIGGLIGLLLAVGGPVIAFGVILGILAGLYVLTDVSVALYGVVAITFLIPFGTLPVKIGLTPTLLDMALGAFVVVYLAQWMTGRRAAVRLTPVHGLIAVYALWLILSFALGLRHASPTSANMRQFAETLLSIAMTFILVDLLRDPQSLHKLVLMVLLAVGAQALAAFVLYALPDELAERTLIRLARLGYPNGGVIRYIEDNPALDERAIGTWVDPNALGGVLAIGASMITPQIFARRPVLRWRWLAIATAGIVTVALILTYSRASMLAFAFGLLLIAARYRKLLIVMIVGFVLLLFLPQTQAYIERFAAGFMGADLATQMRIGEYTDSLRLISRYPITGVGFTGSPDIDIYTDAASMYLIMANQIGLVGVAIFLTTILSVFVYGLRAWQKAHANTELDSIYLGYHAALLTAMVNGGFDLYFFRLDFQASITLFWLLVALALASARLARDSAPTEANPPLLNDAR